MHQRRHDGHDHPRSFIVRRPVQHVHPNIAEPISRGIQDSEYQIEWLEGTVEGSLNDLQYLEFQHGEAQPQPESHKCSYDNSFHGLVTPVLVKRQSGTVEVCHWLCQCVIHSA